MITWQDRVAEIQDLCRKVLFANKTAMISDVEEKMLRSSDFFFPGFELFYKIIGISSSGRKGWKMTLLYLFFNFRVACGLFNEARDTLAHSGSSKYQMVVSIVMIYLIPGIEFFHLFFKLRELRSHFDGFLETFYIERTQCDVHYRSVRRVTLICLIGNLFRLILNLMIPIPDIKSGKDWLVDNTFFGLLTLGKVGDLLIAYPIFLIECFALIYVPLSTSLYLGYAKLLFSMKLIVLKRLNRCSMSEIYSRMHTVEDLQDSFESILSICSLNWLIYGLPGCLVYLIWTFNNGGISSSILLSIIETYDFILTIVTLFFISKWQEEVDASVDCYLRTYEGKVSNYSIDRTSSKIQTTMKKRVTVWHIFPIDRSLILGYMGSAITFTTLLMQIKTG